MISKSGERKEERGNGGKRKEERGKRKEERGKRKEERGKRKEERGKRKKVLSVSKHGFVFSAQRTPKAKLEIYNAFQDRLTFLNRHMIV